jgi:hypothetical protein
MQDAQKFAAEAKLAGASIASIRHESDATSAAWHYLGGRGFWLNQIFFTMRRVIYGLTLTFAGLGAVAIATGFQFNAMMEQQQLAFKIFTGSLAGARKEVQFLYNLAATGPFEFTQVIQGARQLQAFGFTVEETNKLLVSLQDAMAGMGLDQAALDRATLALGQIRSSGRLLGQDLRQLEQLGLVSPEDLARRLRIPQTALANIGQLNIPSKVAINAIEAYWTEKFHGAATQFQHTWLGELSTIRDYGRSLFGTMVEPLQKRLETGVLPVIQRIAQDANKGFKTEGMEGFFKAIDKGTNNTTNFLLIWQRFRDFMLPLMQILLIVTADFVMAFRTLGIGTKIILPFIYLLQSMLAVLKFINPVLQVLITLWVAERAAIFTLILAKRTLLLWTIATAVANRVYAEWQAIVFLWTYRQAIMDAYLASATILLFTAQVALTQGLKKAAAMWEVLTLAMEANPFVLIATAIIVLTAGLVILYFKWKWFHNLINHIATWIMGHYWILALVPVLGPFLVVTGLIIKHISTIIGWVQKLIGWVRKLVDWISKIRPPHIHIPGAGFVSKLNPMQWLAHGGDVVAGGVFGVGERGPEMVALPAGAAVRPMPSKIPSMAGIGGAWPEVIEFKVPVYIGPKQVAEVVDEYRGDVAARK